VDLGGEIEISELIFDFERAEKVCPFVIREPKIFDELS
jgi:hypothetical protein